MINYKDREINYNKPVYVYRRLYRNSKKVLYSIKQNGLVVGHSDEIFMYNCDTVILKSAQKRCRETGIRNVHAFIRGFLHESQMVYLDRRYRVCYNPMIDDDFVPTKKPQKLKDLSPMSVEELGEYVEALKAEIVRADAEIAKKKAYATAASSFFKT